MTQGIIKFVANFITPKFYTNDHDNEGTNEDNNLISDMVNRQMEEEKKGPRDLYNSPMLSSQRLAAY